MLTHLSLFSGIGGLDIAAEAAGFRTVGQCELADYSTKILEKHWPDVPRWRDIRTLTEENFYERTGLQTVSIISGGFPCQPHSLAGKRLSSDDERDMWPEMRRVIREIKPKWVVGENVRGLLSSEHGMFFRGILRDLAELGYDVGWGITSAAGIGAVHRRNRVAIIAHACCDRLQRRGIEKEFQKTIEQSERIYLPLLQRTDEKHISSSAILRKYDGVPCRMDRTKCLGNAVVPAQFYPIFKAIADVEALQGGEIGENDGTTD